MEQIVYGAKSGNCTTDKYVLISMHEDGSNHIYINFTDSGHACVYHFIIKDPNKYEEFVNGFSKRIAKCKTVDDIEFKFNNIDDFIYQYLDDYPEYEFEMRTEDEISEYMNEACDRVWLIRKQNMFCNMLMGLESIDANILDGCNKAIDEVCKKYDIDFQEPVSDWNYGYWSGILSALRWVMGEEKDCLDT